MALSPKIQEQQLLIHDQAAASHIDLGPVLVVDGASVLGGVLVPGGGLLKGWASVFLDHDKVSDLQLFPRRK